MAKDLEIDSLLHAIYLPKGNTHWVGTLARQQPELQKGAIRDWKYYKAHEVTQSQKNATVDVQPEMKYKQW